MALEIGGAPQDVLCGHLDLEYLKDTVSGNDLFTEEVEIASRDLMGHMKYPSSFRLEDLKL